MSYNIVGLFISPVRAVAQLAHLSSPFFCYPETSVLSVDDDQLEDSRVSEIAKARSELAGGPIQSKDALAVMVGSIEAQRTTVPLFVPIKLQCHVIKRLIS